MSYKAPVKDMLFVMQHLANIEAVSGLPGFEDYGLDTAGAVLEESAKFCEDVVAPLNWEGDKTPSWWHDGQVTTTPGFKDAFRQFAEGGWQAVIHPPEYGGQGFPKLIATACQEMLNAANMSFALCPLLTDGAIEALLTAGSDELKATYLEKMISGQWTGSMNLTEPQAGSDLAAVRTRAEPQADGSHKVFGTKIFITWGEHDMADNIVHLVLARCPARRKASRASSLFIVPKFLVNADGTLGARNDVHCVSDRAQAGHHGQPDLRDGLWRPRRCHRLTGRPGEPGLEYMFIMMNAARFDVGMQGVAIAERAYQRAATMHATGSRAATSGRRQRPVAIIHHPDVRRMLLTMRA